MKSPSSPRPGRASKSTRSGRPVMALLDLLSRRWQLRVLWELRGEAPLRFRALQEASGASPSVLNTRLAELSAAGIVTLEEDGYALTREGRALLEGLAPLNAWAERWAKRESR